MYGWGSGLGHGVPIEQIVVGIAEESKADGLGVGRQDHAAQRTGAVENQQSSIGLTARDDSDMGKIWEERQVSRSSF